MSTNIKCILFDCMETLIDMIELPTPKDYALWAYENSNAPSYFDDFEKFYNEYLNAKKHFSKTLEYNREYDLYERFEFIAKSKSNNKENIKSIATSLMESYWHNYSKRCYVKEDTLYALKSLSKKYRLGVVSNFMVNNGIEELLLNTNISSFFEFVITSVNVGWRKPHPLIYSYTLEKFGFSSNETIFVGDDYINDFLTPKQLGFHSILLDRKNKFFHVSNRITNFYELVSKI